MGFIKLLHTGPDNRCLLRTFYSRWSLILFYDYTRMPEMAFSAFLLRTNILEVSPKENLKFPIEILFICWPIFLNIRLEFSKEFLDRVKIRVQGGKYINLTPISEHICFIRSKRWNDILSITSTDLGSGHLPQCWRSCLKKNSNANVSVEPLKIRDKTTLSCV
jgi:hypothetical protein